MIREAKSGRENSRRGGADGQRNSESRQGDTCAAVEARSQRGAHLAHQRQSVSGREAFEPGDEGNRDCWIPAAAKQVAGQRVEVGVRIGKEISAADCAQVARLWIGLDARTNRTDIVQRRGAVGVSPEQTGAPQGRCPPPFLKHLQQAGGTLERIPTARGSGGFQRQWRERHNAAVIGREHERHGGCRGR